MLQSIKGSARISVWFLVSSLLLTGCFNERSLEDSLDDYNERLSYVLDIDLPATAYPSLPALAASSTIRHDIEALSINLREFYALQDCELGRVVAQRNTSLGKSQLPSQRLVYESKLLSVLDACKIALDESQSALTTMLNNWQQQKRSDYAKTWANLIQTSKEFRLSLNTPEQYLSMHSSADANASINALYFIDSVKRIAEQVDSSPIDSAELEDQLQTVESTRLPASIWRTQLLLSTNLTNLTTALTPQLQNISCPDGRASEKAKILRNVFYLFFIEEIQPVASLINQYHYKLLPLWNGFQQHPALHADFKRYIVEQSNTNFTAYSQAMHTHVSLWQGFLKRCNLSPVAPTRT